MRATILDGMKYDRPMRVSAALVCLAACNLTDRIAGNDDIDARPTQSPFDAPPRGRCPDPPAGVSEASIRVIDAINGTRRAMGIPCATLVPALNVSSEKHCAYYVANAGTDCVDDPHAEVPGCALFVGAHFRTREELAGYQGTPASEVMAFGGGVTGLGGLELWANSVWHRTPLFSPWINDHGYGETAGCSNMDFGVGTPAPDDVVVTYPYPGQTGVPRDFDGSRELPSPGDLNWPSGYPITIYLRDGSLADPLFTVDGSDSPIAHVWITPQSSGGLLRDAFVILPELPLAPGTRYRVRATGSVSLDFSFTVAP